MTVIAVLGIGLMGRPMSENLLRAGFDLRVWNRTQAKAAPLEPLGATLCETAAEAVTGADAILTMVSDGPTVGGLIDQVIDHVAPGALWLDMSSIKPEEARAHAAQLAQAGINHLDAPVSGGTRGAEAATLAIMAGGEAAVFDQATQIFAAMGRPTHVGPSGAGQLSKLANQAIVAITIGAVAEAMLLAEKGGADPAAVRAALKGGFADSVILQQHGERMTTGNFEPGGLTRSQIKDLDNALAEAASVGLELPSTQSVRDRFVHFAEALEGADKDHSGLYLELKHRNGLG